MEIVHNDTLRELDAINEWLGDVFGEGTRLSTLLNEAGLSEDEAQEIKTKHLASFIQAVVDLIVNNTANHDGERRNSIMVRHYGLLDGKPETLQSIGDSLELSRERIRQLVQKRVRLYSNTKRKEQFKADIASIARRLLDDDNE
jgi:N-methylhydantoinase B/oxoprolinase/acetone carboxylase alpha subunit